jgi:hypothetical protein
MLPLISQYIFIAKPREQIEHHDISVTSGDVANLIAAFQ